MVSSFYDINKKQLNPGRTTHSSSLLSLPPGNPLLLVDMKSLMTDTEVGFKGIIIPISSSTSIKEQQQHADVSCL